MKRTLLIILCAATLAVTACGNRNRQRQQTNAATQEAAESPRSIDDLLADAPTLVDREVWIEGVCTHTCKHGARKIFLMGSDDRQTVRVESGELGRFDPQCVNHVVRVKGLLREQRIDEAYLQRWQEQLRAQTAEQHGTGEAGCDTEKKARGETGATTEERIADFRRRIEERRQKEDKAYLSFYYVEARSYEVER